MNKLDGKNIEDIFALTPLQEGILFHYLKEPESDVYFEQLSLSLVGDINIEIFERAWNFVIRTNEMLRTMFRWENLENPVQVVLKEHFLKPDYYDVPGKNHDKPGKSLREIKTRDRNQRFQLREVPFRVTLCKIEKNRYELIVSNHHILYDGWSTGIILKEFFMAYHELRHGGRSLKLPVKPHFKEFIKGIQSQDRNKQEQFWREYLAGVETPTELPIKKRREETTGAENYSIILEEDLRGKLDLFVKNHCVTLASVFYTAWGILLQKYCSSEDVIFGTTVSGRPAGIKGIEAMVGLFINTLPLRVQAAPGLKMIDILSGVENLLQVREEFENTPLVDIGSYSPVGVGASLFDTLVVMENYPLDSRLLPEESLLTVHSYSTVETTHYDLTVAIMPFNEIEIKFSYRQGLWAKETIENMAGHFKKIVRNIIENPGAALFQLEIISSAEKKRILYEFNDTAVEYPADKTIHRLFAEQVERTTGNIGIVGPSVLALHESPLQITYKELNEKSNSLAQWLRENGVEPDAIVGIKVERSIEMIAVILGILKAGGAYLPIDPEYPQERIDYMLKDSGAKTLLTGKELAGWLSSSPEPLLNLSAGRNLTNNQCPMTNHPLAYIIYTSGTSGKPKGVLVEHKNVVRLLFNERFQFDFNDQDVWSLFHSYSFDFSVWEMYGALLYGGRLVVISQMTARDPHRFLEVLIDRKVTVLNQTPSAFYNLIDAELKFPGKDLCFRYVIFGGEALKPARLKAWRNKYPRTKLVNMFGITETCVHVTYKEIGAIEIKGDTSNIGKPIPTLCTYIMDRHGRLTPIGTPGELYVGGEGVARGYLNQPELTWERFVTNSYKTGERLYRSGDLVRMYPEGEMVYLGRVDHQVQLRGFRIELGEIETRLLKHEGIKEAVVMERSISSGDVYLCAYIVPRPGVEEVDLETASIREFLSHRLPDYMIPSYVVRLEEILLTANGKIDRRRLPQPEVRKEKDRKPPRNKIEEKLAEAWQGVLELESVGTGDNFFDVGGDSIKAIRLISRINERLNSNLKIVDLYTNRTIGELAGLVHREESEAVQALYRKVTSGIEELKNRLLEKMEEHDEWNPDEIEDVYPMSEIEKGMVFSYMKYAGKGIYHDQFVYPLYFEEFEIELFKKTLTMLVKKNEILRTGFNLDEFEEPVQVVYKEPRLNLAYTDLSGLSPDNRFHRIKGWLSEDRKNPFEPSKPPLWRMHIFTLGNDRIYLVFIFHHAILDGWSTATLMAEFYTTYTGLKANPSYVPPGLKSSYRDMVIQERVGKENERTLSYWREELRDYIRLEFSETAKSKAEMAPMKIYAYNGGEEILARARQAAAQWKTHIKNLCFSAYAYMMRMFSYENDMVLGCVTHNRPDGPDGDKVLGCFLNTVPVRLQIPGNITWKEYMVGVEKKMQEVKKHERLPLFEIALLMGEKNKDRNPFFDTLFNFTDFHVYRRAGIGESSSIKTVDMKDIPAIEGHQDTNTLFDFEVDITSGSLLIQPKYNAQVISANMVKKCCIYFVNILEKYINDPDSLARRDSILPLEEKEDLLHCFNDTRAAYSREKTMYLLFEEQVLKTGDNTAVIDVDGMRHVTYRELNEKSNRLANGLRSMGVGRGDFVGVVMERRMEMVLAVMGILKAGGAYVPLEPYLPDRRIRKILGSLKTKCVVADAATRPGLEAMAASLEYLNHIVSLDKIGYREFKDNPGENPAPLSGPEDISYVIYTSGSTGTPKGVVETHRPVVNVIQWVNKTFNVGRKDKLLFVASLGFDLSVYDIFGVLAAGGAVRTVGRGDMKEPLRLLEILVEEGITFWDSAPAALQQLVPFFSGLRQAGKITGLRLVFLSGDWIPVSMPGVLRDTFKGVRVISLGGATEATIWSNYYPIGEVDPLWPSIPYGKPIQNAKYYILDTEMNLCPVNTAGDLYIGGECLAKEYKDDPGLTAAKFIANPFCPGERLYKTGDRARWYEDGNMQFLGRKDHQVKIRGYRIELGEIQGQLSGYPGISEAIVLDREDGSGNKYICAYYTVERAGEKIEKEELISYLRGELPEYMMPAHFIWIDRVPVTPNGKLDRNALPEPGLNLEGSYAAPGNELEEKVLAIWKEVLFGRDEEKVLIGIDDDFFQLGGHSLNATVLIARIHKMSNVKVPLAEMFRHPTIRELAEVIKKSSKEKYAGIKVVEKKEYYLLSSAQKRLYILQQMNPESTAYNMPEIIPLPAGPDRGKIEETFKKLVKRHESLRTSFHLVNDMPVQKIHDNVEFEIGYDKVEEEPHSTGEIIKNFMRAFDLSQAPLLRVKLVQIRSDGQCIILVDMPHIIIDGVSRRILVEDFAALTSGKELPAPRLQYKDYVEWLNNPRQQAVVAEQETYWLQLFEGEIPVLNLPIDYSRPQIQSFEGSDVGFIIGKEDTRQLKELALKKDVTLYMVLQAIYDVFLFKVTGQEDVVVGTGSAGRRHHDLQDIMGIFVNTLVIRNFPKPGQSFAQFLKEVKKTTLEVFENQEYPFEELVEKVNPRKDTSRNPLFDTMLVLQNFEIPGNAPRTPANDTVETITSAGMTIRDYGHRYTRSKFDLTLFVSEVNGELHCSFEYCTRLFKPGTIRQFINYIKEVAVSAAADPGQSIKEITRVSRERKEAIIQQLNRELQQEAAVFIEPGMTLQRKLNQSFKKFSSRVAIEYGEQIVTYNELSRRAGKITQAIIDKGIPGPTCAGILLEDRVEVIAVMMGILNAGRVFVPLDPSHPRRRLDALIRGAGIRLIFTDSTNDGLWDEPAEPILVHPLFSSPAAAPKISLTKPSTGWEDCIYIYFTSGTTGTPRAMMGKNRSLLHFINWEIETFGINERYRFSQFITPVFDAFLRDVFVPLLSGGVICIPQPNEIMLQSPSLIRWVERRRIHLIHCVPALFRLLVPGQHQEHREYRKRETGLKFKELKYILLSGERINPGDLPGWYEIFKERIQLVNLWGTSETTLAKTYYFIQPTDIYRERVSVGKPLPGARVVVLHENLEICDPLVKGQLYIKTPFRTLGYHNEPALNRERFIPDPFSHDSRVLLHQTGDQGRMLIDGMIDVIGRNDRQVKINGIRVELEEIENVLSRHERVREVVVLKQEISAANELLCAYITVPGVPGTGTGSTGAIAEEEYRRFLSERLPGYMVPGKLIILEKMPRKPNGKVDYDALPDPLAAAPGFQPPRDAVEEKLLESLSDILKIEPASISVTHSFFELGGNSLNIMTLIARIHRDFDIRMPLAEVFRNPTIEKQADIIRSQMALELPIEDKYFDIKPIEDKEYYMLSSAQKRLYVLTHLDLESTAYNMPGIIPLPAGFDLGKISETFKKLVKRHESLRTSFHLVNDMPVQKIHDNVEFEIDKSFAELFQKRLPEGPPQAVIKSFIRPFDLSYAPLLRVGIVKNIDGSYILLVDMHHIISDGVSHQVLVTDYQALYNEEKVPSLLLQYKDFSLWQNGGREKENLKRQEAFWVKEFAGEIPVLELPTDYPRPLMQSFAGNSIDIEIADGETRALNAVALQEGVTLFMVLAAVFNILLFKLSGQEEIIVGTPIAGRRHTDLEKIIGMFVNTLPLRNYPAGDRRFREFLGDVKERVLMVFENQEYPFEELVDKLSLKRDIGRNPLFDVMFVLQNMNTGLPDQDKETEIETGRPVQPDSTREYENLVRTAKFDLTLTAMERNRGLFLTFQYCTKLFKKETIERFIIYFKKIVSMAVKEPDIRISDLDILTEEEKKRILDDFNKTAAEYPKDKTVHRLFEEQVERTPDNIAAAGPSVLARHESSLQITYKELNEKSNSLAQWLRENGVEPDAIVGIKVERSIEMIAVIFGILKSGGAYLPIDPEYPQERIDYMLKDSSAKILITAREIASLATESAVTPEALLNPSAAHPFTSHHSSKNRIAHHSSNLAYVIYTSGSSGWPKGVAVEHSQLVNFVYHMVNRYDGNVGCDDSCLSLTNIMFDVSVWEFFLPLLFCVRLVLMPDQKIFDVFALVQAILKERITLIYLPPGLLKPVHEQLKNQPAGLALNKMLVGVEPIRDEVLEDYMRLKPGMKIINGYGPTETTICASSYNYLSHPPKGEIVPIGVPLDNNRIILLDALDHLVPQGIPGEICISGDGVARGYINNPGLTAEKYSPHPYFKGKRLYRSGDLARLLPDGNLLFIGRKDNQLKIRGYRIEPGEIENRLLKHPGIREAVVLPQEDAGGDKYLAAYIVSNRELADAELQEYLLNDLPDYMIPSCFVKIAKIPLTSNGKIDRKVLPKPGFKVGESYTAPRNEIEKKLIGIWKDLLNPSPDSGVRIGIDDHFFELGGHSLKATLMTTKIHKVFNVTVPLAQIFKTPFIRGIAGSITAMKKHKYTGITAAEEKEYYAATSAQKRLYLLQQMKPGSTAYNLYTGIPLEPGSDAAGIEPVLRELIARHDILRTSFEIKDRECIQKVHKEVKFEIEYYDLQVTGAGDGCRWEEEGAALINSFIRPFDLSRAPLFRWAVIKHPGNRYTWLLDMHHIITDGTSHSILEREFNKLKTGNTLPPQRLQYKDYAQWQNSAGQQAKIKNQAEYWHRIFAHEVPVLELPYDFPRPRMQSFAGNRVDFEINEQETAKLKETARENEVTLYMLLLAIFNILYAKLSGQEDIVIGTPIAARRHEDIQQIVGMMVNTLAMRNYPTAGKTGKQFLQEVKQQTLAAYENQEYPFEDLVENVPVRRDTSRNPIFDVMLNLLNQAEHPGKIRKNNRNHPSPPEHINAASRFDMVFSVIEREEKILFMYEYCTHLFTKETAERCITYLKHLLTGIPGKLPRRIREIEIIPAQEKKKILRMSQGKQETTAGSENRLIHQLFEQKAGENPGAAALVYEDRYLSYGELNKQANRLAAALRQAGIGPDKITALMAERSLEMIVALLAIIKAGGGCLPIEPDFPMDRVLSMLNDSRASGLITQSHLLERYSLTALKNMQTGEGTDIIKTPRQPQIVDFDGLPLLDRTLIDYRKYHQYIGEAPAMHTVTLQATRGCPYNCLFCHKIWPKKHVVRSAENVFKEIFQCYQAGVKRFVFIDDIFNLEKTNSRRLLEKIIKNKLDIQLFFPNGLRGDILTKDFIDLMVAAGTINIDVALESASPRIQKLIGKNLHLDKFKENVRYIAETYPQVILEMEMMHGFPTETEEEAMMTLDFLKSLRWVHFPNLHVLKIFPNTDICRLAVENGIPMEAIERSANLAFHQLPETLPFSKNFTRQFQTKFMGEYFLLKERLMQVIPVQARVLTQSELIQKYDSYLPTEINSFSDILRNTGLTETELGEVRFKPDDYYQAPDFCEKMKKYFPIKNSSDNKEVFGILLLDLSQLFTGHRELMLHHQVEEPLGLLYLMTYLNERFKDRIRGKVAKSMIDFNSLEELKAIIIDFKPDLIGIRTLTYYKDFFHQIVLAIKQWGVKAPIIAGGPYATSDYRLILQDFNIDLVVLGEGETVLGNLVEKIMANNKKLPGEDILERIPGIAFVRNKNITREQRNCREVILLDKFPVKSNQYPDENPLNHNQPEDMFYVIYTSGSTGKPKGVMLEHRSLANLIHYQYKYTAVDFSRVLQFTNISFDVSFQEIFSTLLAGGRLTLVDKETINDIPELFKAAARDNLKTLFLPASFLKFVMNEGDFAGLIPGNINHIVTAGEQVVIGDGFREYLQQNRVYLHNHYGPSETHVVTLLTLSPSGNIPEIPSIGRPVSNTAIYIVDKGDNLLPIGVPGQLLIGGIQVGRGYLNNPELTAERFKNYKLKIINEKLKMEVEPFGPILNASGEKNNKKFLRGGPGGAVFSKSAPPGRRRQKIYQTGDLARWFSDGTIQFLGRIDHQVKIRGFRVELGEIESQLLNHPGIKEVVVTAREEESKTGNKYLCAYIVSNPAGAADSAQLREYLSQTLPGYMIPSYFVQMENIPLTTNRKIDRKSLPAPELKPGESYTAPRDEIDTKLVKIWSDVLSKDGLIGIDDNFFELGGHSLKATILNSRIYKELHVNLPLSAIFQTPSIRALAAIISGAGAVVFQDIPRGENREYYPLSYNQSRLFILHRMKPGSPTFHMPGYVDLRHEADANVVKRVLERIIRRHESFRTALIIVADYPYQVISTEVETPFEFIDLSVMDLDPLEKKKKCDEVFRRIAVDVFDLFSASLFRAALVKLEHHHYRFIFNMHHIVSDGWSMEILKREFNQLYEGYRMGRVEELPGLSIQYKDFALWQNRQIQSAAGKKSLEFWQKKIEQGLPVLQLLKDSRESNGNPQSAGYRFALEKKIKDKLKRIAADNNTGIFVVMYAVLGMALSRLSGQEDVVTGILGAGRNHDTLQHIMGFFVNTLIMKNPVKENETFIVFLRRVNRDLLEMMQHQDYPLELVFEQLNMKFPDIPLLFNMFSLDESALQQKLADPEFEPYHLARVQDTKFEIVMFVVEYKNGIQVDCHYRKAIYKKERIQYMMQKYLEVLKAVAAHPDKTIKQYLFKEKRKKRKVSFVPGRLSENRKFH